MKKLVKFLPIIIMVVCILSIFSPIISNVNAVTNPSSLEGTGTNAFDKYGQKIIGMVQAIGSIVSVLVLVILGIKYMMGSAEEKADYKKSMMPYIVGAALIFAASALAQVIYQFFTGISAS